MSAADTKRNRLNFGEAVLLTWGIITMAGFAGCIIYGLIALWFLGVLGWVILGVATFLGLAALIYFADRWRKK